MYLGVWLVCCVSRGVGIICVLGFGLLLGGTRWFGSLSEVWVLCIGGFGCWVSTFWVDCGGEGGLVDLWRFWFVVCVVWI